MAGGFYWLRNGFKSQKMETATSFGGPFILLPKSLAGEWSKAMGDSPDPASGLYREVCQFGSFMHLISFYGVTIVRHDGNCLSADQNTKRMRRG